MPNQAKWYFDFVSPFSYLQFRRLDRVPPALEYEMVPVLFAGLLKHWEHKGPAEIQPKRVDTYRHCQWLAGHLGVPFQMPQAHPFNPLPYLRLCLSLGSSPKVVGEIFNYIWDRGGARPYRGRHRRTCPTARRRKSCGPDLNSPSAKQELRANTEQAIAEGVYGVPTFVVDTERFWGLDQMEMLSEWFANQDEMTQISTKRFTTFPSGL